MRPLHGHLRFHDSLCAVGANVLRSGFRAFHDSVTALCDPALSASPTSSSNITSGAGRGGSLLICAPPTFPLWARRRVLGVGGRNKGTGAVGVRWSISGWQRNSSLARVWVPYPDFQKTHPHPWIPTLSVNARTKPLTSLLVWASVISSGTSKDVDATIRDGNKGGLPTRSGSLMRRYSASRKWRHLRCLAHTFLSSSSLCRQAAADR